MKNIQTNSRLFEVKKRSKRSPTFHLDYSTWECNFLHLSRGQRSFEKEKLNILRGMHFFACELIHNAECDFFQVIEYNVQNKHKIYIFTCEVNEVTGGH